CSLGDFGEQGAAASVFVAAKLAAVGDVVERTAVSHRLSAYYGFARTASSRLLRHLNDGGINLAIARQGKENDEANERLDGDDEDAAFGAGGSAAEDRLAHGVGGEEEVRDHGSAVGNAIEEGLGPVP